MLLRLKKFDFEVSYREGVEMFMADPLSRAYLFSAEQNGQIKEFEEVWNVSEYVDMRLIT